MFRYDTLKTTAVNIAQGPHYQTFHPQDELIHGLFSAQTGSTYRSNKRRDFKKNETADVFHGALSLTGLPIAVILDGCGLAAENQDIQRSASRIMDMLENLSLQLEGSRLPEDQLKKLLKQEYLTLDESLRGRTEDAVFSALVVFKDYKGQLKALSFSTGDTMLALDNRVQVKTVLAAKNIREQGFLRPLPFPCPRIGTATLERTLNNLEIDIRSVTPKDRFIFLTDGAYEHLARQEEELTSEDQITLVRSSLQNGALQSGTSTLTLAQQAESQTAQDFNLQAAKKTLSLGDDMSVADVLIPTEEQQRSLQIFLYEKAKNALQATLTAASLPEEIRQKFNPVMKKIHQLRSDRSADLPALTKALIKTNQVICHRDDEAIVNNYLDYAKKEVSTKTSFLWKALGLAMMAAGTALALLGGLTLVNPPVGCSLLTGGVLLATTGAGFFTHGYKNNLQKDMTEGGQVLQIGRGRAV